MTLPGRAGRILFFTAGLMGALAATSAAWAQLHQTVPLPAPIVLSGGDVGFEIRGRQGETPVGDLVVRINDRWVPVKFEGRLTPVR